MVQQAPLNTKLKTCLKMCIQRLRYAQEKQQALAKLNRRDVAQLLFNGKEQKAQYRIESLISNDVHLELLEIMELYCELLHARVTILGDIENEAALISNHVDDGINEACRAIVYATLYVPEAKELAQAKDLLTYKFGPDFIKVTMEDKVGVSEKIIQRCSPKLPSRGLVIMYMKEIARTYKVPYSKVFYEEGNEEQENKGQSHNNEGEHMVAVNDYDSLGMGDASSPISTRKSNKSLVRNFEVSNNTKEDVKTVRKEEANDDDLEQLKRRFAALRR